MVFEPDFLTYKGEAFAPSLEDVRLITELRIKLPEITKVEAEFTLQSFIDATDRSRSLSKRISSFIAGESQLSRGIGTIFDFVTIFVPFGKRIDNGRDALRLILKRKTEYMPVLNDKPWYSSKSLWAAILVVLTALAQHIGVDPIVAYELIYALAGAFGLYGLRAAIGDKIK